MLPQQCPLGPSRVLWSIVVKQPLCVEYLNELISEMVALAGLQVNSSTYSSRSNYVRVNAKRTYILLVHGALRWYIVLTYLPCVARWPAPPGVLTCSASAARLRRGYLLPLSHRPSDVTQRPSDVTQRPSTAVNGHLTSLNGHLTSPNQLRST